MEEEALQTNFNLNQLPSCLRKHLGDSPPSRLSGSEIDGELDDVGDGDADVAQLNFAERQRLERQSAALQLAQIGFESAARERADCTVAFAFELRNFRHEIAVEIGRAHV